MSRISTVSSLSVAEQFHRRVLLLGVGTLIVFSTSPVFGHHLATRADALLAGYDHIGMICLIALHMLLAPVHLTFHVLLPVGVAYAIWDRSRAWLGMRRTLAVLNAKAAGLDDKLNAAARSVGLVPDRLRVVEGLPNPAFTTGLWRPMVYVAAQLSESLDASQLRAVLAHEQAHVVRRDPLRLSLMRFLACTLFYIPALRSLADDLADEAEIDADDAAAAGNDSLALASAILSLADWPIASSIGTPQMSGGSAVPLLPFGGLRRADLLERRVRRLAGEAATTGTHVTRRSLGGAGAVLFAVWISGLMMAHPLPAETSGASSPFVHVHGALSHCRHPGSFPLTHLFCLGRHQRVSGAPCPHTGQ